LIADEIFCLRGPDGSKNLLPNPLLPLIAIMLFDLLIELSCNPSSRMIISGFSFFIIVSIASFLSEQI